MYLDFECACRCSELRYQLFRKEEDNADLQRALSACEDTVAALTAKLEEVRSGTVGANVPDPDSSSPDTDPIFNAEYLFTFLLVKSSHKAQVGPLREHLLGLRLACIWLVRARLSN